MAWLHSAPKQHIKEENPQPRLSTLKEEDPRRTLPSADKYIIKCFDLMGVCSSGGMSIAALTWSDVKSFCDQSAYRLSGWQSEQVVLMSRDYCSMAHQAKKLDCLSPYNEAANSEEAMQTTRNLVAEQFAAMKAARKAEKMKRA